MEKTILFNNKIVNYSDLGEGFVVVLLHGYIESSKVWGDFSYELSNDYRVISIDLLGHGKSLISNKTHSMELMAEAVEAVLEKENVKNVFMIGHSMGGYVALAYLEKFGNRLSGFSLFHSSPYSDSDEKIKNRNRELVLVNQGKKSKLYSIHVPKTFAADNIQKFKNDILISKTIAKTTQNRGIASAINGMKIRKDRSSILKKASIPFLYIIGKKDNFIPMSILDKLEMPKKHEVVVLENSGHMGFVEESDKSIKSVKEFIKKNF